MESKLHQKFQYQWPKTVGFFTAKQHEKIIADFECNDNYYVTEKLDGSNLAISSKGYIASRTKVIATRSEPVPKFNQHSLHNVVELFSAVDQLYNYLQTMYFIQHDFELLVFGEFLYNGTASCKFDKYNYVERHYLPEHFYAFGIGLVFSGLNTDCFKLVQRVFSQVFQNTNVQNENFFVVPIDWALTGMFYKHGIECVNILSCQRLQAFFKKEHVIKKLLNRSIEGYILASMNGHGMLKLKYATHTDHVHDQHMVDLSKGLSEDTFSALQKVYKSADDYINTLDDALFKSFFEPICNHLKTFIDDIVNKVEDCLDMNEIVTLAVEEIIFKMKKHYSKKLDPAVVCEIKDRVTKKLEKYKTKHAHVIM
jgi:hypothetical protein